MPGGGLAGEKANRGFSAKIREAFLEKNCQVAARLFFLFSQILLLNKHLQMGETAWGVGDKPPTILHVYPDRKHLSVTWEGMMGAGPPLKLQGSHQGGSLPQAERDTNYKD